MSHTATVPFNGDSAKAFDLAIATLTPIGFRLEEKTPSSLRFSGPGMLSSRQSPLLGASSIQLVAGTNELVLTADLAGLRPLSRFIVLFPLTLCLFLLLLAVAMSAIFFPERLGLTVVLASLPLGVNALMWLVLGPVLIRFFTRRTHRALDVFLHNLAVVAIPV